MLLNFFWIREIVLLFDIYRLAIEKLPFEHRKTCKHFVQFFSILFIEWDKPLWRWWFVTASPCTVTEDLCEEPAFIIDMIGATSFTDPFVILADKSANCLLKSVVWLALGKSGMWLVLGIATSWLCWVLFFFWAIWFFPLFLVVVRKFPQRNFHRTDLNFRQSYNDSHQCTVLASTNE